MSTIHDQLVPTPGVSAEAARRVPIESADWWLEAIACPDCRAPLLVVSHCNQCGRQFATDDKLPVLMPNDRTVVLEIPLRASTDASLHTEALRQVLSDPPLAAKSGETLPYHLDRAHAHVLQTLPRGARVLEIGCGGGQARPWLRSLGHEYVGVDVSTVRVFDWLQRFGGPDLLCDAHRLPFRDEQFDVVYCAAVFEHLACPMLATSEICRVLKPGGYMLANCAFLEPWHDNSYYHMSPSAAVAMTSMAGLQLQYVWPGRNYSGFRALMVMSSTLMNKLRFLGQGLGSLYRLESWLNRWIRDRFGLPHRFREIEKRARVAGAVDWIAQKPVNENATASDPAASNDRGVSS